MFNPTPLIVIISAAFGWTLCLFIQAIRYAGECDPEWQKIEDGFVPTEDILVFKQNGQKLIVYAGSEMWDLYFGDKNSKWIRENLGVTHWQYLPEDPVEDEGE